MWLWPRQLHSWYGYRHVSNRRPCQGEADARADSGSGPARRAAKRVQVDVDRRDRRGGRNHAPRLFYYFPDTHALAKALLVRYLPHDDAMIGGPVVRPAEPVDHPLRAFSAFLRRFLGVLESGRGP